jgi:hypothetical protein
LDFVSANLAVIAALTWWRAPGGSERRCPPK